MIDFRAIVEQAAPEELPGLAGRLAEASALLELRLRAPAPAAQAAEDRNLSAREAAKRLGVSLPYLYKHAASWPFARRIGKRVLFSARGLEAWNRGQRPALTARSLEG